MIVCAPMLAFSDKLIGKNQRSVRLYVGISRRLGFGRLYVHGGMDDSSETGDVEHSQLTSDRDRFARNRALAEAAPELLTGWPTIGWTDAAYRSMRILNHPDYAAQIGIPLLIFVAGQDTIVDSTVTEAFAARLKFGAPVALPSSKHEILQETD